MAEKIKVLIAHELKLVAESLAYVFRSKNGFEVMDTVTDSKEFVQLLNKDVPTLALMDANLPGIGGVEAAKILKQKNKKTKILMLSMNSEKMPISEMNSLGVADYITFEEDEEFLFNLVKRVLGRKRIQISVDKPNKRIAVEQVDANDGAFDPRIKLLTKKEREVLRILTSESDNDKMAKILDIKPATVITHKKHLIRKLDVKSTAELVIFAFRNIDYLNL